MNIKVTDKTVTVSGREMFIKLLTIEGVEGWTSGQVQDYLDITQQALMNARKRCGIRGTTLGVTPVKHLKLVGAVSKFLTHSKFFSKDEIREIAMVVNSERAKEMIRHAFDVTEAVYKGDIKEAQTLAGFSEDEAIEQAERAIAGWKAERAAHKETKKELSRETTLRVAAVESALSSAKMVAEAEKVAQDLKANAVDTALKYCLDAVAVGKRFPKIKQQAMVWRATQWNREKYNAPGWVSIYLTSVHNVPKIMTKDKGKFEAYIFNLADIKRVNEELTNA